MLLCIWVWMATDTGSDQKRRQSLSGLDRVNIGCFFQQTPLEAGKTIELSRTSVATPGVRVIRVGRGSFWVVQHVVVVVLFQNKQQELLLTPRVINFHTQVEGNAQFNPSRSGRRVDGQAVLNTLTACKTQ